MPSHENLHPDLPGAQEWFDKKFIAYVTAVLSVNTIWAVVRTPDYARFCDLTTQMAEFTGKCLEKLTVCNVGTLCLSRFSVDNCWYRSRITQVNAEQLEVIFVDYGNKEWKNVHDLYLLPFGFEDVSPQAQQFSLNGVILVSTSEVEQRMVKFLDSIVTGKTFLAELVYSAPGCIPEVILRENDGQQSINQQMINSIKQTCTPGVFGQRHVSKDIAADSRKEFETQSVQGIFQEWPHGASHHPVTTHATDNIAVSAPVTIGSSCDPISGFVQETVPTNVPTTSRITDDHPFLKPTMASQVLPDVLPSSKTFDIFVCYISTPNLFWIWFLDTAKELLNQLTSLLSVMYEQSTYSEYVPIAGELIAVKFKDEVWYRAKVDCIDEAYSLKVTFIDFGNTEDVSIYDTRRIADDIAAIPRLAIKCSLHAMEEPTRKWSAECIQFCNELMLNKRGTAKLQDIVEDKLLLQIDMEIEGEMRPVVDEIVNQGYSISEKLQIQDSVTQDLPTSAVSQQNLSSKEPVASHYQHLVPDIMPVLRGNETVSPEKPVLLSSQPVSRGCKPVVSNMKPPLPCQQSALAGDKPVDFSNPLICPSEIPTFKPVISSSSPVLPANQRVSSSTTTNLPANKPAAFLEQPVFSDNVHVNPVSHSDNKRKFKVGQFQPDDYLVVKPTSSIPVNNQKSGLQSAVTSPQLSPVSPNVLPAVNQEQSEYRRLLPMPTFPSTPFDVIVNDVLSGNTFYAQMINPCLVSQLHKLVRELNQYVTKNNLPKVKNVVIGSLGCAKFCQDNIWYRARVVQILDVNYRVRFIDFGNTEDVSPDEFLETPELFYQVAPQAMCCRLGTSDHLRAEESRHTMKTLTLHKQLSCTVMGDASSSQITVKLLSSVDDQVVDIAEELDKAMRSRHYSNTRSSRTPTTPSPCPSSCKRQTPSTFTRQVLNPAISASGIGDVGKKYEVKILYAAHPTYFWIQPAETVENVKSFQGELNNHYNNSSYPTFKPLQSSFCVYMHQNGCFRVFVRHSTPRGLVVHSVDYGFQFLGDEKCFRPLEEKFYSQPFGAMLCSMGRVVPCEGKLWTDEAKKYFRSKVGSKLVEIRVIYNSKSRLFVDIFDPDSNDERLLRTALVDYGMAKELPLNVQAKGNLKYLEENP